MTPDSADKRAGMPKMGWLLAAAVLLVVAAANAHLLYVSLVSQPECIAHLKETGSKAGEFRAANSAC